MGEEINAAKIQTLRIVEQRRDSPMEPSHYVLVPFHDPGNWRKESPSQVVNAVGGEVYLRTVLS